MRIRRTEFLLFCVALITSLLPAFAEPAISPGLEALRKTPTYQQSVYRTAQNTTAWINNRCDGAKATIGTMIGMLKSPVFDGKGQPQSGAWIEHVAVKGCGVERQLNVLLLVKGPDQVADIPLLPGTTKADPTLQKDGSFYAFAGARVDPKGCKPIYLLDTEFLGYSAEKPVLDGKPAWSERWTVAQCDKHIPVVLKFIPAPRGTTITADVVKTRP